MDLAGGPSRKTPEDVIFRNWESSTMAEPRLRS